MAAGSFALLAASAITFFSDFFEKNLAFAEYLVAVATAMARFAVGLHSAYVQRKGNSSLWASQASAAASKT